MQQILQTFFPKRLSVLYAKQILFPFDTPFKKKPDYTMDIEVTVIVLIELFVELKIRGLKNFGKLNNFFNLFFYLAPLLLLSVPK